MKKLIAALLCAALMFAVAVPVGLAASEAIELEVNGKHLTLNFDGSEQFSSITDGLVQASFYAYDDGTNDLYELYMMFPKDVQPGTTLDPEYARQNAPDTSVVMIVTTYSSLDYYFAGQSDDARETDYTMTFDSVTDSDKGRVYSGTLSASMVGISEYDDNAISFLSFTDARFSFTMPMDGDAPSSDFPAVTLPPEGNGSEGDGGSDDYDPFNPFAAPTPAPTQEVFRI